MIWNLLNSRRFSIAVILVLTAFVGQMVYQIRVVKPLREDAVKYVESNGGSIGYSPSRLTLLKFLRLTDPTVVSFHGTSLKKVDWKNLEILDDVNVIQLSRAKDVDVGLAGVGVFPKLDMLILSESDVTASGLVHLKGHLSLVAINLEGIVIDSEMMNQLASIPNLEYLFIENAEFDPADLSAFNNHEQLKSLIVTGTAVTDDDVETILTIPNLEAIRVESDQFSDESIAELMTQMDVAVD